MKASEACEMLQQILLDVTDPDRTIRRVRDVLHRVEIEQGTLFEQPKRRVQSSRPTITQVREATQLVNQYVKAIKWAHGVPRGIVHQCACGVARGRADGFRRRLKALEEVMSRNPSFLPPHPDSWFSYQGWAKFAKYDSKHQIEQKRPNQDRAREALRRRLANKGGL